MNTAVTASAPVEHFTVEMAVPPAGEFVVAQAPPSPEEIRAMEAAMAEQAREAHSASNLIGLWTSIALLHNLGVDHFQREEIEEEKARGKKDEEKE